MKNLLLCGFFLLAGGAFAETREVAITAIDYPKDSSSDVMVKISTGEVLWVAANDSYVVAKLKNTNILHNIIKAEIDTDGFLTDLTLTPLKTFLSNLEEISSENKVIFYPTIHSSEADIRAAFDSLDNRTHEDSQCYNRAHPWAYDLWRTRGINSMKIFLFFTDKYIREFRHKWWFHVAPMTYLSSSNGKVEYVLDRSFSEMPLFTRVWTNTFIKNHAECRSVNTYFEYFKDSPTEYCYLIRSTMFYRGTVALRKRDQGVLRSQWNMKEMREARQQAFIYASDYNP